jgi:hypothetical protein
MVSVQRRLNSTGRKRITRDRIVIELFPSLDTVAFPSATAQINLEGLDLERMARVVLEAYFRSSSMRFPCGTLEALHIPTRMHLTDIDRGGAVQFRLLVIAADDSGRILASAEGLKPLQKTDSPDRQPLLRLRETDIGEELWRVDLDDRNGPWLVINSRVPGLASQLRSSSLVQGLILPHALRAVLDGLPAEDAEADDDDWGNDWRKFLEQLDMQTEPDDPSDDESRHDWIEEAVERFCSLRKFAELLRNEGVSTEQDHG